MTFDVDVHGRRHHVEVVRTADGDHVSIDGRLMASQALPGEPFWSLLVEPLGTDGARGAQPSSYEIAFEHDEATNTVLVHVDGRVVPVRVVDRRRSRPRTEWHGLETSGTLQVRSPMPGRVVRVHVAAGQTVEVGQPLVVVEAMKMENELRASRGGVVTDVAVEPGTAVEAGAVLVVLD